jgi:hypothetical protein
MGINEYVVLFVAVVYFLGGYVLGRFHNRGPRWTITVDPDPLRVPEEGIAEVIPLRPLAARQPRERVDKFAALGWVADHSRTGYRGIRRPRG